MKILLISFLLVSELLFSVVFFTDDGLAVDRILEFLHSAEREVLMVAYSLDEPLIIAELNELFERGVRVKAIVDNSTIERTMRQFPKFPVLTDNSQASIHAKFSVVDGEKVLFGTGNFTQGSLREDSNSFIVVYSRSFAADFTDFYRAIAVGESRSPFKHENMVLYLCPSQEAQESLINELLKAKTEIKFAMFAFTDPSILAALKFKASRGVQVMGIIDSWNDASPLREYLTSGMKVVRSEKSYTVHDKTFVVDGKVVITGSANSSLSGWGKNRETVAIIYSREVAECFSQHIEFLEEVILK